MTSDTTAAQSGIIRQLDSLTASQIAAGEVVERPLSVVKELVENAIDAAASRIDVQLTGNLNQESGQQHIAEIQVVDNGCGILPVDLPLAFGRHATSKLSLAEELSSVRTLGFRGEALPSIAAVSRVEITSCAKGEACAWQVQAADGQISQPEEAALAQGTRVIVRDLFYNTPARRKFLKSYATETGTITKLLGDFILARPDIAFSLQIDGRQVLRSHGSTAGNQALSKATLAVYGAQVLAELRPVQLNAKHTVISGFASMPPFARASRRYYHFFVNGRLIKSPELNAVVDDAYQSLLPAGRYPLVILSLQLPTESVDINVHPAKTEIRFKQLATVREAILTALREALLPKTSSIEHIELENTQIGEDNMNNTPPTNQNTADNTQPEANGLDLLNFFLTQPGQTAKAAEPPLKLGGVELTPNPQPAAPPNSPAEELPNLQQMNGSDIKELLTNQKQQEPGFAAKLFQNLMANAPGTKVEYKRDDGEWLAENYGVTYLDEPESKQTSLFAQQPDNLFLALKPLGQLNNSYIIATLNEDLYIIDQHAAHERILYEEFSLAYALDCRDSSQLASPVSVDVGNLHAELLLNNIARLADCGFVLEHFGGSQFVIRAVPLWYVRGAESDHKRKSSIYDNDIKGFFLDIFELLLQNTETDQLDVSRLSQQELFTKACKSAVKANEHLNGQEISWLLYNLAECDKPQTCPHGRPTFIKLTDAEIRRRFMRS